MIGGYGGTRQVIRRTVEGDDLFEKVQLKDLISDSQQERVLIQMTKGSVFYSYIQNKTTFWINSFAFEFQMDYLKCS